MGVLPALWEERQGIVLATASLRGGTGALDAGFGPIDLPV